LFEGARAGGREKAHTTAPSAKCPVSSKRVCASGLSRPKASAPVGNVLGKLAPCSSIRRTVDLAAPSHLDVESLHFLYDVGQGILDREVAGVQPMNFCTGEILEIRLAALAREEDVVLSPENNGLGLLLS
jgi:hypothetical protein